MNRLVLAFGIVCLLQGLSAEPRPEYGLSFTIRNSDKITAVATNVGNIVDTFDITTYTPTSGYTKLSDTQGVLDGIIGGLQGYINPILDGYTALVAATDGDVDAAFADILAAISDALAYLQGSDVAGVSTTLNGLDYNGISNQFEDEVQRVTAGVSTLQNEVTNVKAKIVAAVTAAGSDPVTAAILRTTLTLSDMYNFLEAASNLQAFLPLFEYIISTADSNVEEADTYINNLQDELDTVTSNAEDDYTDEIDNITSDVEATLIDGLGDIYDAYADISGGLSSRTVSATATGFGDLGDIIDLFVDTFSTSALDAASGPLDTEISNYITEVGDYVSTTSDPIEVKDNPLVQLLVDTLIGNLEYGPYCYHKYKDLVENLLSQGSDDGFLCVDKEYIRLLHLQDTLELILDLLAFDYENIEAELDVCESVGADTTQNNDCIVALTGYYTDLQDATERKRDLAFLLAKGEIVASKNRLLICMELVFIDFSVTQVDLLTTDLENCADDGPTGTLE
ncbi:uncharacterized protein LOC131294271 [Anopheles ziemanni]|uniref:uncharacterized protein LOC131264964 n=1 Tax=Anopheles coustani TaxID=139045 RepID=UPI00265A1F02|nr:uncharacterized protein LOC131264964 [Anopheles coustani]XP_058178300.1 uncharacterized protein LOC131294271 [Anopheles ziemanni]